ncbi:MAG: hypothetical protein ACKVPJ_09905 [Chitinophagales bacterium]
MKKFLLWLSAFAIGAAATSFTIKESKTAQGWLGIKEKKYQDSYSIPVQEYSDASYPHNPDISIQSKMAGSFSNALLDLQYNGDSSVNFVFHPTNFMSDTIILKNVNVFEWVPYAPTWLSGDEYLASIALINQEWNRVQVKFETGQFEVKGTNQEKDVITRVDIANNCLNAGLWEIICFTNEDGTEKPISHGWFDFPMDLYAHLFERRNTMPVKNFKPFLRNWSETESEYVNLTVLRKVEEEKEIQFANRNNEYYPVKGERQKKMPNIISPDTFSLVQHFLSNDTKYANFDAPGIYNRNNPRQTELGRFYTLNKIMFRDVTAATNEKTTELELFYTDEGNTTQTRLIFGGLKLENIPTLKHDDLHKGYQISMGISNHSFYESYKSFLSNKIENNAQYALVLSEDGKWLDSHKVGIDGVLFYYDEERPGELQMMLLSFERHSFVGKYSITLPNQPVKSAI